MEVHPASWQNHHVSRPFTSAPCDQRMMQPHHQHRQSRASQSQDVEWQKIVEELETGSGNPTHDFDMFGPSATMSAPFHSPPMQSIETSGVPEPEPQMSATSSSSSSFSYMPANHHYQQLWPTISAPTSTFSAAIPEHEQWAPPQHYHQHLGQANYRAEMMAFELAACHPPSAHHLIAGPSPFLSEGSSLHQDFMDEGWEQPDMQPDVQQLYLDGSGSDELDADSADPCYAQLLYRCLKESPDHTLSLRELYDWVKEHSQKAKDPKNRGWQNSVRHNLSMNAVRTSLHIMGVNADQCRLSSAYHQANRRVSRRAVCGG